MHQPVKLLGREFLHADSTSAIHPMEKDEVIRLAFYLLVAFHMAIVLGVICSFFLLPFFQPWYVALPIMVFIFAHSTTRVDCKLTEAENYLRVKLGYKRIGGFVKHYLIKPVKGLFK